MSVNAQQVHGCGKASSMGEAFYFSSGAHHLFGWLHHPSGGNSRSIGLVICKPFGYEAICSHSSIRAFAEAAAAIGVPALRFDYLGTGDSADIDLQANQLDVWSQDVLAAIDELRRRTGVERVCLLGIRLGALLAAMAARQSKAVTSVILISPIISGRRYLRELRISRLAGLLHADPEHSSSSQEDNRSPNDGSMEASGFVFSAATLAALTQVDMTQGAPPASEMLIIDGSSMPVAGKWAEALSAAAIRTQYMALPGLIEMVMTMPHDAKPPDAMLAAMRDWLTQVPNAPSVLAEGRKVPYLSGDTNPPPTPALELPGEGSAPDGLLTERPLLLASDPAIFGILTEPHQRETRRRAVILVNAGATYHVGPNRVYVSLARRWARSGYFVLRMDLAGLGDSGTRSGRPDNEVFPPAALDDIRAAVEFVRLHYRIDDMTICGICSGAYHALRAAVAAIPVNRIFMVNLENFFWKEGTDIHALETAEVVKRTRDHRERLFSVAAWKRLATGQVNIWRILNIYMRRPLLGMESVVRDWARLLHIRLPRDVGSELEQIASRGVRVVFAFARGETGIDLLRIQGGSSVKRLGELCRVHIINSADHIFSQAGPRAVLEGILSDELFAQNRSHSSSPTLQPRKMEKIKAACEGDNRRSVGVVVIGRNEGDRLRRCLNSVRAIADRVVYVDSGSIDDSVSISRALGVLVVELDMVTPFTAARARNAGFRRLIEDQPCLDYVFFVDGDCEVVDGWLDKARRFLDQREDVAVVCGRRTEKYPEKSVYNMLIDMEWKVPPGETKFCGGDALMRVGVFQQAKGFRPDLICGEEPELCFRLRQAGWRIWCMDEQMTVHDAAIYRFEQWWKRALRSGYGFASGAVLYGGPPERLCIRECRRIWGWGFCFPVTVLALTLVTGWWALSLLMVYPLRVLRLFLLGKYSARQNWWRAVSLVICQFPEFLGQLKFALNRFRGEQSRLIEYK